jgi:hypothetical protein
LASLVKRVTSAISPRPCARSCGGKREGRWSDELGGGQHTAAWFGEQRCAGGNERAELGVQLVDGAGELADAAQLVARDPDARGLLGAAQTRAIRV